MELGYITDFNNDNSVRMETTVNKNLTTIDGYTPKNNKCFTFPFNYMLLTTNSGKQKIIKYENFDKPKNQTAKFSYFPVVGVNPELLVVPDNYNGLEHNYDYGISFDEFMQLPWNYDGFKNWFAQNSNKRNWQYVKRGFSIVSNIAKGAAGVPGLINDVMSVGDSVAEMADMRNLPEETRGTIQGNSLMYSGGAGCYVRCECSRTEYITMVDDYFTRYGYLVNETKKPNLRNRKSFDYVQTQGMNLTGGIPQNDLDELNSIFDRGITIWHNPNTVGDYNVSNETISK